MVRGTLRDMGSFLIVPFKRKASLDRDRIKGSVKQAKGAIKQVAAKVAGDTKLESEGKADKFAGKVKTPSAAQRMPFAVSKQQG